MGVKTDNICCMEFSQGKKGNLDALRVRQRGFWGGLSGTREVGRERLQSSTRTKKAV